MHLPDLVQLRLTLARWQARKPFNLLALLALHRLTLGTAHLARSAMMQQSCANGGMGTMTEHGTQRKLAVHG